MRSLFVLLILAASASFAQSIANSPEPASASQSAAEPQTPDAGPSSAGEGEAFWSRFWLSFQANFIRQQHPSFPSKYSGPNSFQSGAEHAASRVETLYSHHEAPGNPRRFRGRWRNGLSSALGVAGFTNVDVVRNPTLGADPYVARVMLHFTIPLSKEITEATRSPLSLASEVPTRRLELRMGKMSTVDFFDLTPWEATATYSS